MYYDDDDGFYVEDDYIRTEFDSDEDEEENEVYVKRLSHYEQEFEDSDYYDDSLLCTELDEEDEDDEWWQ